MRVPFTPNETRWVSKPKPKIVNPAVGDKREAQEKELERRRPEDLKAAEELEKSERLKLNQAVKRLKDEEARRRLDNAEAEAELATATKVVDKQ